jgi:hypothetical protein
MRKNMKKMVNVITRTTVTYDGSITSVVGVYSNEEDAFKMMREDIEDYFSHILDDFKEEVEDEIGDEDEDIVNKEAKKLYDEWIDERMRDFMWCYSDDDGMEINYEIHSSYLE